MPTSAQQSVVRLGMIGAGMVGQLAHLANFKKIDGCEVVALAELRPELGQAAADRFGIPKVYDSHHALLDAGDVDAVVVVTRRPATGPIVLDALAHGCHVLSEKPMAHTLAQANVLADAADAARRHYQVGFMKRHDAGLLQGKLLVEAARADGRWGRLISARCYSHGGDFAPGIPQAGLHAMTAEPRPEGLVLWPPAPDWIPSDLATDYAWFLNVFVHDLNLVRWVFGATPRVRFADLSQKNGRFALLDFDDFTLCLDMAETDRPDWQEGIEITFDRASVILECPAPLDAKGLGRVTVIEGGRRVILDPPADALWCFHQQAKAFVQTVLGLTPPVANGRDCLDDLALAESIWQFHAAIDRSPTPLSGHRL